MKNPFRHRNHKNCSIYAPCRAADLERSWNEFRRAVDDPTTREVAIKTELKRIKDGKDPA